FSTYSWSVYPFLAVQSVSENDSPWFLDRIQVLISLPSIHIGGEPELLRSCYRQSLLLAKEHGCETAAFPLISAGVFGYPKELAFQTATGAITDFLTDNDMTVYLVLSNRTASAISQKLYSEIKSYIDDVYVDAGTDPYRVRRARMEAAKTRSETESSPEGLFQAPHPLSEQHMSMPMPATDGAPASSGISLDELMRQKDESFSQMLLRKIDEKGMTDAQCYKKANIDRKLFSKIRGDAHYRPSKPTAIAFAIALELPLEETRELLMKAGYALSRSNEFDIIIEYFIRQKNYNVYEINEALFSFDQNLLGA
ncbi:MAG: macro domain-containing protein, partial [Oscillospiraceae bacterium]|nr:macro domain-containing protein [Oscillospiraceae bacterium]